MDQIRLILGMGSFILLLMFTFGSTPLEAAEGEMQGPRPRILSFSQWKEEQTTQANNRLVRAENQLILAKSRNGADREVQRLEREKEISSQAVEITKEFTIEDYFVVYLAKLGNSGFILREAAKMLSDDEVAELMKVFIQSHQKGSNQVGSAWVPSFGGQAANKL